MKYKDATGMKMNERCSEPFNSRQQRLGPSQLPTFSDFSGVADAIKQFGDGTSGGRKTVRIRQSLRRRTATVAALATGFVLLASAHIRIAPTESAPGAREKYTMRVPNEKQVNSTKIVGEFPEGLDIYDFEFKPGWSIEFKKNDKGKIMGATWTGTLHPYEFIEFGMLGINPKEEKDLVWRFVQYYDDGTREEFTGPAGSRLPSPITKLKKPADAPAAPR